MKKISLPLWGFINSLATIAYVVIVAYVLASGEKIFGKMDYILGPIVFLTLFIFSALVVGILVLGRPIYLFFENQKSEGIKLLFITVGYLFVFMILSFALMMIIK